MNHNQTPDEAEIRDLLRSCPDSAIDAAIEFRVNRNRDLVPMIVSGVFECFVEPEVRGVLNRPAEYVRLIEDLEIDSLVMLEIVMVIEDCFNLTVESSEIHRLQTLGEVITLLQTKLIEASEADFNQTLKAV